MPIYAYKCESCGHRQDILRKISDPPLTQCPACATEALVKQVTSAGFQLKGSGWYVTDFRDGSKGAPAKAEGDGKADAKAETPKVDKPAAESASGSGAAKAGAAAKAPAASTATPAAAGGSGKSSD